MAENYFNAEGVGSITGQMKNVLIVNINMGIIVMENVYTIEAFVTVFNMLATDRLNEIGDKIMELSDNKIQVHYTYDNKLQLQLDMNDEGNEYDWSYTV